MLESVDVSGALNAGIVESIVPDHILFFVAHQDNSTDDESLDKRDEFLRKVAGSWELEAINSGEHWRRIKELDDGRYEEATLDARDRTLTITRLFNKRVATYHIEEVLPQPNGMMNLTLSQRLENGHEQRFPALAKVDGDKFILTWHILRNGAPKSIDPVRREGADGNLVRVWRRKN